VGLDSNCVIDFWRQPNNIDGEELTTRTKFVFVCVFGSFDVNSSTALLSDEMDNVSDF
jgi:hypothetical protein